MYCPNCGAQNPEDAAKCLLCDHALKQPQARPETPPPPQQQFYQPPPPMPMGYPPQMSSAGMPPSMLPWSIAVTLCCCMPFGVVSIVYAAQVSSKWNVGDSAGAWDAAQKAKMWAWIGFGLGLISNLLYTGFMVLAAVAEGGGF